MFRVQVKYVLCLIMLLSSTPLLAKRKIRQDDARIIFQKTAHDFGKVMRGDHVRHSFVFKNEGSTPLKLISIEPACSCTVIEHKDRKGGFRAGQESFIELEFASENFIGTVEKVVKVRSNDQARPELFLKMIAHVVPEFIADPPLVDFGEVQNEKRAFKKTFTISSQNDFVFEFKKLIYNESLMDIQPQQLEKGKWQFEVTLKPSDKEQSFLREKVIVQNTSKHLPELEVFVLAKRLGRVRHDPSYLDFGVLKKGSETSRHLKFESELDLSMLPLSAELSVKGKAIDNPGTIIQAQSKSQENDKNIFEIKLSHHQELAGNVHGHLSFKSNDPDQKPIKVNFYAFFD